VPPPHAPARHDRHGGAGDRVAGDRRLPALRHAAAGRADPAERAVPDALTAPGPAMSEAEPLPPGRHVEAFLEMLAAERGAARNTLAAYLADLADFTGFAAARG